MSILGGLIFQPETSSTVLTEIVNKTTTEVIMSSINTSSQSNISTNTLAISDIRAGPACSIDITTAQSVIQTPNFSSSSELDQSSNIGTAIKDALESTIKNTSRGVQFMSSPENTETINRQINDISASVSNTSIVTCLQSNTASNDLLIQNVQSNCPKLCSSENISFNQYFTPLDFDKLCTTTISSSQDIVQAAVASCLSKNKQVTDAINELASTLVTSVEQEKVGIDPEGIIESTGDAAGNIIDKTGGAISGIFGSLTTVFIIVGILVIVFFLYMAFGGGNETVQNIAAQR